MRTVTLCKKIIDKKQATIPRFGDYGDKRPHGPHKGIDFALKNGTPIYAVMDGLCTNHIFHKQLEVWVSAVDGSEQHRYVHLSRFAKPNGRVKTGDLIGYTGDSGTPGSFHLHFERLTGKDGRLAHVDPTNYLLCETPMTGTPILTSGTVQANGAPQLIGNDGGKIPAYAGFNAVVEFDAQRTSQWSDSGGIEFRSKYEPVWIHINDIMRDSKGNPIINYFGGNDTADWQEVSNIANKHLIK